MQAGVATLAWVRAVKVRDIAETSKRMGVSTCFYSLILALQTMEIGPSADICLIRHHGALETCPYTIKRPLGFLGTVKKKKKNHYKITSS